VDAFSYAIHGGTTDDSLTVTGLTLDYDVSDYFFMYGLSLARLNRCTEAIPIFQALLAAVPGDEIAVYNANAGLEICQENIDNPPTETPVEEGAETGVEGEVLPTEAPLETEAPTPEP
jgi:hypothetical protein